MRLRRETGDFSIDVSNISEGPIVLPKNLSKEDLIGCIVTNAIGIKIISDIDAPSPSADIALRTSSGERYLYNPESGELMQAKN